MQVTIVFLGNLVVFIREEFVYLVNILSKESIKPASFKDVFIME